MLTQRLQRWPNIKTASFQRVTCLMMMIVYDGYQVAMWSYQHEHDEVNRSMTSWQTRHVETMRVMFATLAQH